LAHKSEQAVRTDPNTCVDTLIDNAKQKYGVEVPRSKAYKARKKAFDVVMGDQKKQYTRLRDYLEAILQTNPGSRCIVTCRQLVEHPSENPRFHGLFICFNASKEGFLNGCRPFIGMLATYSYVCSIVLLACLLPCFLAYSVLTSVGTVYRDRWMLHQAIHWTTDLSCHRKGWE
jgi:hypothetical protein